MIDHLTTILVTTSPRPAHPSTELIEDTVASLRYHLPTAPIIILCDGVRKEQENRCADYSAFVLRVEMLCLEKWNNVRLWVSPEFLHQAWVIGRGLEQVTTPLILFVEDDLPPLSVPIPWHDMALMILEKKVNLVRLMLEDELRPEWAHLMLGPVALNGVNTLLTKTVQWSQRTHLASTEYYRSMVAKHLKPADRCYLEERFYGQCDDWDENKLTIFTPLGKMARIWHSDGRRREEKFESVLEGKE